MDRSLTDGTDYSGEAAVGSFFSPDFKRHDDLKQMLDSNRDNLKLEAMKRIIGMVAKGRDASELFPAVVKNVVSKNTEVKKLVYVYLVRYAEEQQDLALLSISTFQRALKDPNQLIRASALRVLSSIRVPVIVPIVMLAIRDSAADMSPYVRKTAAHAIPKLYSLDQDQKEELVQILDKLLADRTTLVVGSAVMAFEEVCPERIDLIHKNFRKLCSLLMDVDEWGQVVILNMLTRYARTQFVDPNLGDLTIDGEERPFYDEDNEAGGGDNKHSDSDDDEQLGNGKNKKHKAQMDPDHRLLLKNCKPLLQSRNAAVVMAVAQLYHHVAPKSEVHTVVRALIRLLRSHTEVQAVVLTCIAAMSTNRKSLFEPYMKSFFVRSNDPTQIKLLKLEILTNIANETNIPPILREFQTYISSQDKEFVGATIQAIGRCASNIKEVAETCLNGLVSLLSHRDPAVVGGAVVVSKTLLQSQRSSNKPVIAQLARMVDRVTVAPAKAAILWLLGEHCERLPNLPPDVLRKMAKTFADEDDIVKLQIINLAAKLQLTNPTQTSLLCQYILNLAKYDQSYDIRDRARFIRQLLFNENSNFKLAKYSKKIFLASKPAPVLQSKFKDRDHFQLGSLSHFLNTRAMGYQDLPTFPVEAPDPSVRNVEPPMSYLEEKEAVMYASHNKSSKGKKKQSKKRSFYSESEESDSDKSEGTGSGSESTSGSSHDDSGSGGGSGTEDSESDSASTASENSKESGSSDGENANPKKLSTSALRTKNTGGKDNAGGKPLQQKPNMKQERKVVRYKDGENSKDQELVQSGEESGRSSSSGSGKNMSSASSSSSSSGSGSSTENESDDGGKKQKVSEKKVGPSTVGSKALKGAKKKVGKNTDATAKKQTSSKEKASNVELLLDLDLDNADVASPLNPVVKNISFGQDVPSPQKEKFSPTQSFQLASPVFVPVKKSELLTKIVSGGLTMSSRFTRSPHLVSALMTSVELQVCNVGKDPLKEIRIGEKGLSGGISVHDFSPIELLEPEKNTTVTLGIDFNDTTQGAKLEILWTAGTEAKKHSVTIKAPIGELIRPVIMSEASFLSEQGKLRGMNEHEAKTFVNKTMMTARQTLVQRVYETANLIRIPSTQDDLVRFAGQSTSSSLIILLTIQLPEQEKEDSSAKIVVNCEKIVLGSMLLQELKEALK